MDGQDFEVSSNSRKDSTTVKDWMQSIQDGKSPDRLSEIDQVIDGSIGGLKDALENVLHTNRAVPLFEFRRLAGVKTRDMKDRVSKYEQALVAYHKANTQASARFMPNRRDADFSKTKRQDSPACAPKSAAAPTPTPSPSVPATDRCDIAYQFSDDYFEIRGRNFNASKLGQDGDSLKGNVQHCGALTDWEFTTTPKDST